MTDYRHPRTPFRRQRGLALITAVLVVSIAATIAAFLALGEQVWLRQVQNLNDRARTDAAVQGAIQYAFTVLTEDRRKQSNTTDDLSEDWAKEIAVPIEGGAVKITISDAQARININKLVVSDQPNKPFVAMFDQLMDDLDLDPSVKDAVVDWLDTNTITSAGAGAEDVYYLTLPKPYRAANREMESVEELRLVRGIDDIAMRRLRQHVTALPITSATPVNINTANELVLRSLFSGSDIPANLGQVIKERDEGNSFTSSADLAKRTGITPPPDTPISVKSEFFYVDIDALVGRFARRARALVYMPDNPKQARLQWLVNTRPSEKFDEEGGS